MKIETAGQNSEIASWKIQPKKLRIYIINKLLLCQSLAEFNFKNAFEIYALVLYKIDNNNFQQNKTIKRSLSKQSISLIRNEKVKIKNVGLAEKRDYWWWHR